MTALTPANQLTLLRMLLIPAFVILVVYGYLGWALVVVRDRRHHRRARRPDRAAGRARRRASAPGSTRWPTSCCSSRTFVVLTLPGLGLDEPAADLADGLHHQPRRRHRADGRDRQPRDRPAHVPAVDLRQDRDRHLHRDGGGRDVLQLPRLPFGDRRRRASTRRSRSRCLGLPLHLARGADHRRASRMQPRRREDAHDVATRCYRAQSFAVIVRWRRLSLAPRCARRPPPKQAVVETSAGTFIIDLTPESGAEPGRVLHEARAGGRRTTGRPSIGW